MDEICYNEISLKLLDYLKGNLSNFKAAKEVPQIQNIGIFIDIIFKTKTGLHTFQVRHVKQLNEETINDIALETAKHCISSAGDPSGENEFTMVLVFDAEFLVKPQAKDDARKIRQRFKTITNNIYHINHIMMYEYSERGLIPYFP